MAFSLALLLFSHATNLLTSAKISGSLHTYCPNGMLRFFLIDWYFILPRVPSVVTESFLPQLESCMSCW